MTPSLSVAQDPISPADVTITDTSSSVTASITGRRLFISDANGTYLTGNGVINYDVWALADLSYLFSGLPNSIAANILVQWVNVSGTVVEEYNSNYPLSEFSKQFAYSLIQSLGLSPGIYMDTNYAANLALLWTNIIGGDNAVTYGNDIAGAQNAYNRAIEMENNESYYF